MHWYSGLEHICRTDVPLRDYTWYRLGGPARWFFEPRDEPELAALVARCRTAGVPWRILGRGANVIVRDAGYPGAVIRLSGACFEELEFDGTTVRAGAAVDFANLVRESIQHGLVGLEIFAGIPGSVGGIVRMNAGGRYGNIADFVRGISLLDPDGNLTQRDAVEIGFAYRHTDLDGCVILGVEFALCSGDRDAALRRYRQIWNEKHAAQPPASLRSAGCIFKNPPEDHAGRLLDQAGLKGQRVGAAEISARHANFIVAYPGARARDVLDLIAFAKDRVRDVADVELELEVEVW